MDNYVLSDESLNNNNILISFQGETTIIYSTMSRDIKPVKDRWHQLQLHLQTTKEQPTDNYRANVQHRYI